MQLEKKTRILSYLLIIIAILLSVAVSFLPAPAEIPKQDRPLATSPKAARVMPQVRQASFAEGQDERVLLASPVEVMPIEALRSRAPYMEAVEGGGAARSRLRLKSSEARVQVAGVIAQVKLSQVFVNTSDRSIDARYVFAASHKAAISALKMRLGDRVIEAQIQRRAQAQKTFDRARAKGQTAGLLEQRHANLFEMQFANVPAGGRVEVDLFYSELLSPRQGQYQLVIPTVAAARYGGDFASSGQGVPFSLSASISSPVPIAWLRSNVKSLVRFDAPRRARLRLPRAPARGDVVLSYSLQDQQMQTGLLLGQSQGESYFLLMAQPPKAQAKPRLMSRELIFVVDVSGSMRGDPLDTAKQLIGKLLSELRAADRFNIVLFAGDNAVLAPRGLQVTSENLLLASIFIDAARSRGGSKLLRALDRAYELPRAPGRARSLVLISDGLIRSERRVFARVRAQRARASFFAFGVGKRSNRALIEGLARVGRGASVVVQTARDATQQARSFGRHLRAPLIRHVEIDAQGLSLTDLEPPQPGDLFLDQPLLIMGKIEGESHGEVHLRAQGPGGPIDIAISLSAAQRSEDNSALATLWARARLRRLSDERGVEIRAAEVQEITALGLRHHLLTEFTSFVAVDRAGSQASVLAPLSKGPRARPTQIWSQAHEPRQLNPSGARSGADRSAQVVASALGASYRVSGQIGKAPIRIGFMLSSLRSSQGAGVGTLAARRSPPGSVTYRDWWSRSAADLKALKRAVVASHGRLRYILELSLLKNQQLRVSYRVSLRVDRAGTVRRVRLKRLPGAQGDDELFARIERDLERLFKGMRLPTSQRGRRELGFVLHFSYDSPPAPGVH